MENAVAAPPASAGDSVTTTKPTEPPMASTDRTSTSESPRLFIVCGRDRKVEQVRELFAACGAIRQLNLATDRSNKSRGFAFLQYEDPASADEAIKRFDKTTLSDGHILKVTVAREKSRPSVGTSTTAKTQPGKLKRNQHSQDDSDEQGGDGSATDGSSFHGKRQRSSPPSTALAGIPKLWKRSATPFAKLLVVRSPEEEIADVLGGIIAQIERLHSEESEDTSDKTEKPSVVPVAVPAAAKRKAPTALTRPAIECRAGRRTNDEVISATSGECETVRPSKLKAQRTTAAQATPNRPPVLLTVNDRRRVPVEESDSSVDDASDASVGRRKRCSTDPDESDRRVPDSGAHARRRLSDLSELSLSPAGISSPVTSKKRCSRRSSASSSSSSLPTFQAVPSFRPVTPIFVPTMAPPPLSVRRRRTGPRAKLFFTSTVKFTLQALEAMFSVYEQFDHVHVIKSFGRVKTMAYVNYATPEAARSVLASFLEDNEGDDHGMMKLAYADSDEPSPPRLAFPQPSNGQARIGTANAAAGESTSSEVAAPEAELSSHSIPHDLSDNCWLMILYDRTLAKEAISSCATACGGMEFMDIKTYRSTGESQGVAFVKFETEEFAQAASRRLHNSEFPVGSSKTLQAIAIADPALFSTAHGSVASGSSVPAPPSRYPHRGEDGDLGFVEARFAHLMSGSSEQLPNGPLAPMANAVSADEAYDEQAPFYPLHRSPAEAEAVFGPLQAGPPPPSPYGYFQFGQPYPYGASGHPHAHHGYRQHPPPFYPHGSYSDQPPPWGYDGMYPMWPGEGGSPMPSDYNENAWEPPTHATAFPNASSLPAITSVFVSSSRPLDLSCLMTALQECPGVVGFSKEARDGLAFVVDFGAPRLAAEAASKLDGTMCNGTKLRVAVASGHRPPPSRRKRQRLDQRGRRK